MKHNNLTKIVVELERVKRKRTAGQRIGTETKEKLNRQNNRGEGEEEGGKV